MINFFFLKSKKFPSFLLKKKNHFKNPKDKGKVFSGGGGNGNNITSKTFFGEEPENYFSLNLFFIFSKKENLGFFYFSKNVSKKSIQPRTIEEVILKNCETIPEIFLCDIYEDLFYQNHLKDTNHKKVEVYKNNWYSNRDHIFSENKRIENFKKNGKSFYFFETCEPKIMFLKIYSDNELKEIVHWRIEKVKTRLISNILNIFLGEQFKFNLRAWNRIKFAEGVNDTDFSIKDDNMGDYGKFLNVTLKLTKKSSMAIEPEIMFSNNQLSISLSFTEKNLLRTGILIKNKILFKKFKPFYMKFEIDDKSLKKYQHTVVFVKYLKDFFSVGFILKKFSNEQKNSCITLGSGFEFHPFKHKFTRPVPSTQLKSSLTISKINFLKAHMIFFYASLDKFTRYFSNTTSITANSIIEPVYGKSKLNGLIFIIENKWSTESASRNLFLHNTIKTNNSISFSTNSKGRFEIPTDKYISLNTLISKHIRFFLILKYKKKNYPIKFFFKTIESKLEIGNLFNFSWDFNNFGRKRIIFI